MSSPVAVAGRRTIVAVGLLLLPLSAAAFAADGDLDTTFRGGGIFLADLPSLGGRAVAVAPDGRLLIGYTAVLTGSDKDMRVMPVPDAGATAFCGDYHPDLGGSDDDRLADIGVFAGRVYLAGSASGPAGDTAAQFAMAAFDLADCLIWSGFGGANGLVLNSGEPLEGTAFALTTLGGVAVALQQGGAGARHLIAAALSSSGGLDNNVTIDFAAEYGATSFEPKAIAMQPDGKRVVVGTMVLADGDRDVGVVRLTANGNIDNTFSGDGRLGFSYDIIDSGADEGLAVAILPGGRIVIGGSVERAVGTQAALAILTPTGGYFNSFGSVGRYAFDLVASQRVDSIHALAIQGDGKVVVAGSTFPLAPSTDSDFGVARLFLTGGQPLDASFSGDGRKAIPFDQGGALTDQAWDLTLGQGGRISVVGSVTTANGTALAAVRLKNAYVFADGFEWGLLVGTEWTGNWGGGS